MKKQYSLFIHSAFFDILIQKKVRQVGLSETQNASLSFTTRFCDLFGAGEQGVETGCGLAGLHVAGSLFVGVEAVD